MSLDLTLGIVYNNGIGNVKTHKTEEKNDV